MGAYTREKLQENPHSKVIYKRESSEMKGSERAGGIPRHLNRLCREKGYLERHFALYKLSSFEYDSKNNGDSNDDSRLLHLYVINERLSFNRRVSNNGSQEPRQ